MIFFQNHVSCVIQKKTHPRQKSSNDLASSTCIP